MKYLIYFSFSFFLLACSANKAVTQAPEQTTPSNLPAVNTEPEKTEEIELVKESSEAETPANNATKETVSQTDIIEETTKKEIGEIKKTPVKKKSVKKTITKKNN